MNKWRAQSIVNGRIGGTGWVVQFHVVMAPVSASAKRLLRNLEACPARARPVRMASAMQVHVRSLASGVIGLIGNAPHLADKGQNPAVDQFWFQQSMVELSVLAAALKLETAFFKSTARWTVNGPTGVTGINVL